PPLPQVFRAQHGSPGPPHGMQASASAPGAFAQAVVGWEQAAMMAPEQQGCPSRPHWHPPGTQQGSASVAGASASGESASGASPGGAPASTAIVASGPVSPPPSGLASAPPRPPPPSPARAGLVPPHPARPRRIAAGISDGRVKREGGRMP